MIQESHAIKVFMIWQKTFEVKNSSLMCDQLLNCKHHQRYEKLCTSYVEDAVILLEEWRSKKA